jgi:D-lactate dehydrogenase
VFSTKPYDRRFLSAANEEAGSRHELAFLEPRLTPETAVLAEGFEAACPFVNDEVSGTTLQRLSEGGTRYLALRCAGFNHVDLPAARELGITVARVPAYSPNGVAEYAVALMLALNRRLHKAYNRVREGNFALEGLLGFEMRGRTAGVLGTGKIGASTARILLGMGMKVLAYDVREDPQLVEAGAVYADLDEVLAKSDVISLHLPLMPQTSHLINRHTIARMKRGVMLINTSRGSLVETRAVVDGLKEGQIGALGMDVYEEEDELFFEDRSSRAIPDDVFARLLTFPNVIITGHQAFFTHEALSNIAATTMANLDQLQETDTCDNLVH